MKIPPLSIVPVVHLAHKWALILVRLPLYAFIAYSHAAPTITNKINSTTIKAKPPP